MNQKNIFLSDKHAAQPVPRVLKPELGTRNPKPVTPNPGKPELKIED